MGNKVSMSNPSKSDRIWQSFESLGPSGLSRLINRWHSCELDALDTRLMDVTFLMSLAVHILHLKN
jgi:hypothetical protein